MMAKLYWRVKRNGKWTWLAATEDNTIDGCYENALVNSFFYVGDEEE